MQNLLRIPSRCIVGGQKRNQHLRVVDLHWKGRIFLPCAYILHAFTLEFGLTGPRKLGHSECESELVLVPLGVVAEIACVQYTSRIPSEDRATLESDPSADAGGYTDGAVLIRRCHVRLTLIRVHPCYPRSSAFYFFSGIAIGQGVW